MAQFSDLYGDRLDRELGSSDRTNLFTTARRKAAINEAAEWFVTQTECLIRRGAIPLVDGTAEYDLEAELDDDDFIKLAKEGASIAADPGGGGTVVYYAGRDFTRKAIPWLDQYEPGWRAATAGHPQHWYERVDGGASYFGVWPPPDIPLAATWTLTVPYVVKPVVMTADADVPFTVDDNPLLRMSAWYDALVYYAGSELEKLRKGTERSVYLRERAEQRVLDYLDKRGVPGGKRIGVARSYRSEARGSGWRTDYGPHDDVFK